MPSPLAHGSLVFLVRGFVTRHRRLCAAVGQRPGCFYAAVVATLCAPDVDFLLREIVDHPVAAHGGATHSLFVGSFLGLLFALACRGYYGPALPFAPALGVGLACAWSHGVMDLATWGGKGIMILWPFSSERFLTVPLFVGVHRSEPRAWALHLATLITELAFCWVLWRLGRAYGARARLEVALGAVAGSEPTKSSLLMPARRDTAAK